MLQKPDMVLLYPHKPSCFSPPSPLPPSSPATRRGEGTPKPAMRPARDRTLRGHLLWLASAAHVAWELKGQFILVFSLVDLASPDVAASWSQLLKKCFAPAPPSRPNRCLTIAALLNRASPPTAGSATAVQMP